MKDWIRRVLGITALEKMHQAERVVFLNRITKLERRISKLAQRPLRYDEVERARKRAKKETIPTINREKAIEQPEEENHI